MTKPDFTSRLVPFTHTLIPGWKNHRALLHTLPPSKTRDFADRVLKHAQYHSMSTHLAMATKEDRLPLLEEMLRLLKEAEFMPQITIDRLANRMTVNVE